VINPKIGSQFVDVDGRRVLVRYAGQGPAVLLLHQSPQNSRALIPWIVRLSIKYAVFAPDTPGFGYSDPLPRLQPTIPDYAAALARLLDTLGLERVLVYGVHTGAVTALRLTLDYPQRIAGLVCDGYARFNTHERQKLLNGYLPPFEPEWNGGHLLWLWSRFREQNLYFPWNTSTREARIAYPAPTTEKLQADILDLLDSGDGYRTGYRAPFLYDDATAATRLTVETRIFYRAEDVLASHLPRLGELPTCVEASRIEGGATALALKSDDFFAAHATAATNCDAADQVEKVRSCSRRMLETPHGYLSLRISPNGGDVTKQVVIYLNDIGHATDIPVGIAHGVMVIAPELPLHGASRPWRSDKISPVDIAEAIVRALATFGVSEFSIIAEGGSAAIAVAIMDCISSALVKAMRCTEITLSNPLHLNDEERTQFLSLLPDMQPHASGGHLVSAWNWVRMKSLFWPWMPQTGANARHVDAPAPYCIQTEVQEIIRLGTCFAPMWKQSMEYDWATALCNGQVKLNLQCADEPARIALLNRLVAKLSPKSSFVESITAAGTRQWVRYEENNG
jgi:pimeloyl-ACP methyl ester carboxylesterase